MVWDHIIGRRRQAVAQRARQPWVCAALVLMMMGLPRVAMADCFGQAYGDLMTPTVRDG
jgi:hypothetical protein